MTLLLLSNHGDAGSGAPPPAAAIDFEHRNKRIAAYLHSNSSMHSFPAREIKWILHTLAEECHCVEMKDNETRRIHHDDQQQPPQLLASPRKRVKRSAIRNNLHSILRFVERVIHRRYDKSNNGTIDEDETFLDFMSKGYFGTEDASFQIEEDILSLAFEIALNAVAHLIHSDEIRDDCSGDGGVELPTKKEVVSTVRGAQGSTDNNILRDGATRAALQLIDLVVDIDRQERKTLIGIQRRQQENNVNDRMTSYLKSNAAATDRRKKHEHLLRTKKCRESKKYTTTDMEVKSIMEEKYPVQWDWLCRWRKTWNGNEVGESSSISEKAEQVSLDNNIVILRRRFDVLDDISLSSDDCDDEPGDKSTVPELDRNPTPSQSESNTVPTATCLKTVSDTEKTISDTEQTRLTPLTILDHETRELRLTLLDMPPSESSSTEVIRHTMAELHALLLRYGELNGAEGIRRCGDIMGGILVIDDNQTNMERTDNESTAGIDRFPLNEAMVSSLITAFLTDAMGALRAKAFLQSFVLPLMMEMRPSNGSSSVGDQKASHNEGKPASRVLTSLMASLARDRPTECVLSIVVPTLLSRRQMPSIVTVPLASSEPTRFQCELISRILRGGKDSLSIHAIALLLKEVLLTTEAEVGIMWTDNTMPVITTCLNRQPSLPDEVVVRLADEISLNLTSSSSRTTKANSMKFSTLFHTFVIKYGSQLKSVGKVESLKESSTRIMTFMSKTIAVSLKKLS